MDTTSGVGVLDKAALVLTALESGPATLAGLVAGTGLARPTAHRLAVALEHHRLVARDMQGRFVLGPRLAELSAAALSGIRRRGWAQSVAEREQGVASVSAPVRSPGGKVIAAVSVSGPLERLSRQPGRMHAPAVLAAAERLSESLRRAAAE